MKNITEENLLLALTSRVKFLEKNYSDLYHLARTLLPLKPQDLINPSKLTSFKENLKTLPHPNATQDFHKDLLSKILDTTKENLSELLPTDVSSQVFCLFEKCYNDLCDHISGKLTEKFQAYKPVCTGVDKMIKNAEKKIAAFQKDARKSSAERKIEFRDITPVRSSVNRSISPAEKRTYSVIQENADLKDQLKRVIEERDVLRAWKENVLKLPGNFSEDSNALFKEHETYKKQLLTGNKVLAIKIQTMASAILKFLKDTAIIQKVVREKEGFVSLNFYENEKSKLELKIRELADVKEIPNVNIESPGVREGTFDFSMYSEKLQACETENKVLRNQLREAKKMVKTLEIKSAELENARWQTEREKTMLERKSRTSTTPTNAKKMLVLHSKQIDSLKSWAESRIIEISSAFESKFEELSQKVLEKENSLSYLRTKFTENLKENLNLLIAMNENVRNSNADKPYDEALKSQVENFEFIIEQHKMYTEIKAKELNETIDSLERERNYFMKQAKIAENENFQLKMENSKMKDLESLLKNTQNRVFELEENGIVVKNRLRTAKQRELEYEQTLYEKGVMAAEITRLSEECEKKDKIVIEMQQTVNMEQIQANKCLEELVFKEKTAKSELEMMKIELGNYKSELDALEKINQELQERLNKLVN